jgi:hypothetical protein
MYFVVFALPWLAKLKTTKWLVKEEMEIYVRVWVYASQLVYRRP